MANIGDDFEKTILRNLQFNPEYERKVAPFLKAEYFDATDTKLVYETLAAYADKYQQMPTPEALLIEFQNKKITEAEYKEAKETIEAIAGDKDLAVPDIKWLVDKTEEFCQDRSLYIALRESISIADGNNKNLSKTSIPDLMEQALAVCFDTSIGHDYIQDADLRYTYHNTPSNKIPSHIDIINRIMNGGVAKKTVNCVAAGTGVGKSSFMCDLAANYIIQGQNVLYITLEMAEEMIATHIDAKLLDIPIGDVSKLSRTDWDNKIIGLKKRTKGILKIKEYPTATAHVGNFRFLIKELKQKQGFVPDVVVVDYMNICASSRIKNKTDTYNYIKSIAEELRGFASEINVALWTATQLNRSGQNHSDVDITNISESMGGPMTFDFLCALVSNEELASINQVQVVQLKNRYSDLFNYKKFCLGIDRPKMKFYDLQNPTVSVNVSFTNNSNNSASSYNSGQSNNGPTTTTKKLSIIPNVKL